MGSASGGGRSGAVLEPLRDGSEDVPEMVRHMVPHLIARPVPGPFRRRGVTPELLCDALLHDPAYLPAGRVALDADGKVSEAFSAEEGEPLVREGGGLFPDVSLFGEEGGLVVSHVG